MQCSSHAPNSECLPLDKLQMGISLPMPSPHHPMLRRSINWTSCQRGSTSAPATALYLTPSKHENSTSPSQSTRELQTYACTFNTGRRFPSRFPRGDPCSGSVRLSTLRHVLDHSLSELMLVGGPNVLNEFATLSHKEISLSWPENSSPRSGRTPNLRGGNM